MSTSCYWNINIVNKLHQEDTTLNPYEIRIGLSVLNDKLLDYFKNDSDALVKTDKIINNLSAEQFRSYMNEINSGRKDAYLDFIKGAKKSKIDFNQKEPEIKQGVSELFESNPELANIGTPEQYSQYLDTIFPDSKVKDIVYHGTKSKSRLEIFDENIC